MIFLVILVAFSEVVVKLYLYYLHSLLVWGALKKYHSKSYIKKSKKTDLFPSVFLANILIMMYIIKKDG